MKPNSAAIAPENGSASQKLQPPQWYSKAYV